MESVVAGNLSAARRGGVPGTYSLVRSFVNLRVPGGYLGLDPAEVDGRPLWASVYYCLRCGDVAGALQCIQQAGSVSIRSENIESVADLPPPARWGGGQLNVFTYPIRNKHLWSE